MTRETLEWLHWLVSQQSVQVGAQDAQVQAQAAFRALDELRTELDGSR